MKLTLKEGRGKKYLTVEKKEAFDKKHLAFVVISGLLNQENRIIKVNNYFGPKDEISGPIVPETVTTPAKRDKQLLKTEEQRYETI